MDKVRVLVVDDSLTVRKHLIEVLSRDPEIEVVGEAEDGKVGIELCRTLRPSVITLDMMMPVMSGVAATEYIMAYCPTPILVVSSSTNRGELYKTYDALAAGAVDVLDKAPAEEDLGAWEQRFVETVKTVSRIRVITHLRGKLALRPPSGTPAAARAAQRRLVAIGGSTGGPGAIVEILRNLPGHYPVPILLVIHIGQPFATAFAEWLDGQSTLPVRYASDGERLPQLGTPGVLMAPPDRHLVVRHGRLHLSHEPERHSCRPSVDTLFESVARELGADATGCLLTGMGRDGALGLLAMRQAGALTIAQDEASSVVFGMPREAIAVGGAALVLALDQIAGMIARCA